MFNIFPKIKTAKEIREEMDVLFPPLFNWNSTIVKDKNGNEISVQDLIKKYNDLLNSFNKVKEEKEKLELQIVALHKIIDGSKETIDNLKKELYEVRMENNSLKVFPIKDKQDVRLDHKTDYPYHWGGYDGTASAAYKKTINHEENINDWKQAIIDLCVRISKLEEKIYD
jgi:predicted  nucleic acid-binding Zn-ribbon protein